MNIKRAVSIVVMTLGVTAVSGCLIASAALRVERVLHQYTGGASDGAFPSGPLLAFNGALYGTTRFGGIHDHGTVFKITPSGVLRLVYGFRGPDGHRPMAGVIAVDGILYGTTELGGITGCGLYGCGVVFALSPSGSERIV